MAKSKTGGSRAYIRGRIGSDVYSVGKDGKGMRQQVVRSLAEQVSNPRTQSQMFGRMVMSTVMQAVSAMAHIIDHSFDGIATGQPSISEFIRRNYALVKADAVAHPASGNKFDLNDYGLKGMAAGEYVVSNGNAVVPAALSMTGEAFGIALTATTLTVGGLKAALGLTSDGYITLIGVGSFGNVVYDRVKLDTALPDTTAITADNVASLFSHEGNKVITPTLATNTIYFEVEVSGNDNAFGFILSDKADGAWIHSACTLKAQGTFTHYADAVLPTYPTGTEQFLNGGDL